MSDNSIISVRNGVISAVVAGIILMIVPAIREHAVRFLTWLWFGVLWCWNAFISSYSLPGWAWIIVFLFAIIGVITIFQSLKPVDKPEHMAYIEDDMFDAKWRWIWTGNRFSNLWCYCPHCDATLVYQVDSILHATHFLCENCSHSVVTTLRGKDKYSALRVVEREIDRRIRTGEYKKKLNNSNYMV